MPTMFWIETHQPLTLTTIVARIVQLSKSTLPRDEDLQNAAEKSQ